ncbi:hypothetical protein GF366_01380 [Candidatus Peregrinibacteria bacterium]|nr:hypothetical protein [Candidatus Peregrinibacteria bacterium]
MLKKIKNKNKKIKEVRKSLSAFDKAVISWIAPEIIRYQKGKIWKIFTFSSLIAAVIIGILYNAWTFSLAIIVFAATYYIINRENPKVVEVAVSDIGIKVGERKYPYNRITAFWIVYDPPIIRTLNIRVKGDLLMDIPIELYNQNPGEVREFLLEKIPELEGQAESLSDVFSRLFKI